MPPGQHKVLIELADPEHHIFTGQTVTFTVPGPGEMSHEGGAATSAAWPHRPARIASRLSLHQLG
jgi:Family of unknown function (DUF6130)